MLKLALLASIAAVLRVEEAADLVLRLVLKIVVNLLAVRRVRHVVARRSLRARGLHFFFQTTRGIEPGMWKVSRPISCVKKDSILQKT